MFQFFGKSKPVPESPGARAARELALIGAKQRAETIAHRKERVTRALERFVASGGVSPIPPRDAVVAGVLEWRNRA